MIIFRHSSESPSYSPYQKALIVFVVGEEPTRGIHRKQFENSVAWIAALQPSGSKRTSVTILGPTFSGSFPALADLLAKTGLLNNMNGGNGTSIFSGGASNRGDAETFANTKHVSFRSFAQDDTTALDWVCRYFDPPQTHLKNLAILSEDETAYGSIAAQGVVCKDATNIYYPRDISSLRAAYQTQSMFSSASGQQNSDTAQRKSLPTDLADPSRQQHDTVRTYAGNQIPLSQEAQLLGIVDVVRAHRSQYVLIRSSNTLDPVFLANFLRRDYPEARIVVLNSDLLFQRGQDAMALTGVMTLSTYPLFSWAREWSVLAPDEAHSHRVFPENSTEGTYIASRLLLQTLERANGQLPDLNCYFPEDQEVFVPPLQCQPISRTYAPLPDYAPPFWMKDADCDAHVPKCRPSTWLSVITRNGTWPLAVLNQHTMHREGNLPNGHGLRSDEDPSWPPIPRSTKVLLVSLCCLAVFHLLCCWFASFTAKPAFRAHFATADPHHPWLVLIGSYLIVLMALFTGWGSGIFSQAPSLALPRVSGRFEVSCFLYGSLAEPRS